MLQYDSLKNISDKTNQKGLWEQMKPPNTPRDSPPKLKSKSGEYKEYANFRRAIKEVEKC